MPRSILIGALLSALFVGMAALSFVWTPYDIESLDIPNKLQPPSAAHLFGTDQFGRDILSMIMMGARTSIAVPLPSNMPIARSNSLVFATAHAAIRR